MKDWSGQKIVVVGAARQGLALARYLVAHGARVWLNDRRPAAELEAARASLADLSPASLSWVCGEHPLSLLDEADWLCLSGGVALTLPLVVEAQRRGIPLSNDSQVFMEAAPCKIVGITGSAGKTTTTTLTGRMAQAALTLGSAYRRVWVGGNIGTPLIAMVDEMQPEDLAVVEFSSFQLELMSISPQVAAILNITPNHLDRHGTMEVYTAAKANIFHHQTPAGVCVLGRDDPGAWGLAHQAKGAVWSFGFSELPQGQPGTYLAGEQIYLRTASEVLPLLERREVALRGAHNLLNVMAACTLAAAAELPVAALLAGVRGFTGVAHRLEWVRSWGGADWYNDSIATAPERAMAALRSFTEPVVLLAGGRDKNLPWEDFAALVQQRVDHLVVFGEAAEIILAALAAAPNEVGRLTVTRCANLSAAVQAAARLVRPGDVVLLSPGGTSFDEFKDFEERGRCFAQWVRELP